MSIDLAAPVTYSNPLKMPAGAPDRTAGAAREFEAVFLSEMMSHIFSGISTDPLFGGGTGEDMFKNMLVNEYGKQMTAKGGIGIATQLQKMMIELQQHEG
jgi:flagellar protein FlgJ